MEYIQEALRKAKQDRVGSIGRIPESLESLRCSSALPAEQQPLDIHYTVTRQLRFSDEQLKARHLIAGFAHDPCSEPYRQLRGQVLQRMKANQWRSLAITSPGKGGGKTLTALNLAIVLSQNVNQTVILVDLDLRNPGVAPVLGIEETELQYGVVDYLEGRVSLDRILINPGFNRLVILPGKPHGPYSSEVLSSPAMRSLHHELTSRYDDRLVIYDLPGLLCNDDAMVFAPTVDSVLFVVEDGKSSLDDLQRSQTLLEGVSLLGTVLNKVR